MLKHFLTIFLKEISALKRMTNPFFKCTFPGFSYDLISLIRYHDDRVKARRNSLLI